MDDIFEIDSGIHIAPAQDTSEVTKLLRCKEGGFKPCYAKELEVFNQVQIAQFCIEQGLYQVPTHELIEYLRQLISGQDAIEIGSGSGQIGSYLNIQMTDNKEQERLEKIAYYKFAGQEPITYHKNVIKIDGNEAIKKFKPSVVVACWLTAQWDFEGKPLHASGVIEEPIVDAVKFYVHVGNKNTHHNKKILHNYSYYEISAPWLYSRSLSHDRNRIWIISKDIGSVTLPTLLSESTTVKIVRH